jgi:hypothetical protein
MVDRHDQDLYRGNGKPGLTTRVALLEDCVDSISKNLSKLVWLVVSGILTGLVAVVVDIAIRMK